MSKKAKKDSVHLLWNTKFKVLDDHGDRFISFNRITQKKYKNVEFVNRLIYGDNLYVMKELMKQGYEGKINLIYVDPPFQSETLYFHKRYTSSDSSAENLAYDDRWQFSKDSYLDMIYPRLKLMKQLLSKNGCIFVHLDWHIGHYVKILMDEIFGYENFRNEIVWHYRTYQGQVSRYFPRKHDTILFYTKSEKYPFRLLKEKDYTKNIDYKRWQKYLVDGCEIRGDNYPKTDSRFNVFIDKWKRENNNREPTKDDVIYRLEGFTVDSVWDIKPVDPKRRDRVFVTQKPDELLARIIKSSSNEGDIVADFFAGSGTTLAVAEKLNRRWIGCEINKLSIQIISNRLLKQKSKDFLIEELEIEDWKNLFDFYV